MLQFTHVNVSLPQGSMINRIKDTLLMREGKGRVRALEDITLWIGRGEGWALLGEKESGKTTLARLAARHIPPDTGLYSVKGRVSASLFGEEGFFKNETGADNARLACVGEGLGKGEGEDRVREIQGLFADDTAFLKRLSVYSDSDKAKLSLCIALAGRPDALVIANQLEYCDVPFRQQCLFELRRRVRNGMTLVLECADEALVNRLCDNAVWLHQGKVKSLGSLENVRAAMRSSVSPEVGKEWLRNQQIAFSAPLAPLQGKHEQLREAELYSERLHEQLRVCAEANLMLNEENQKLRDQAQKNKARLDANEKLMIRMLGALQSTLDIMHRQFLVLRSKEEAIRTLRTPRPWSGG